MQMRSGRARAASGGGCGGDTAEASLASTRAGAARARACAADILPQPRPSTRTTSQVPGSNAASRSYSRTYSKREPAIPGDSAAKGLVPRACGSTSEQKFVKGTAEELPHDWAKPTIHGGKTGSASQAMKMRRWRCSRFYVLAVYRKVRHSSYFLTSFQFVPLGMRCALQTCARVPRHKRCTCCTPCGRHPAQLFPCPPCRPLTHRLLAAGRAARWARPSRPMRSSRTARAT